MGLISYKRKERVLAEYALNPNYSAVAKKYKMSAETVKKIIVEMKDDFNEMREQKKRELAAEIWGNLIDAQKLGHIMVTEALDKKREIPLNHVSNYFGTMYDKHALLTGENTQNIGGSGINVVLNMPDVAEDEESWKNEDKT